MPWQVEELDETCSSEDIDKLANLLVQLTSRGLDTSEKTIRLALCDGVTVVVRNADGRIIGTTGMHWHRLLTGVKGMIDDVVVDEDYRKQGIGRAMTLHLLNLAREKNIFRLSLTNNPKKHPGANILYLSLGFKVYKTDVYRLTIK